MADTRGLFSDSEYWKEWLKSALGGAYRGLSDLTALPIQGGSVAAQMLGGKKWADVQVPDPMKGGREYIADLTGLPVDIDKAKNRTAFGFGQGAVPGPTAPAALVGGTLNAVGETLFPENGLVKTAINLSPLALLGMTRGAKAIREGSLRDVGKAPDFEVHMPKGQATGRADLMAEQDFLERYAGTADKVAKYKQAQSKDAKAVLKRFMDKAINADDAYTGEKAAKAWKAYEDSQLLKHQGQTQREFTDAMNSGKGKSFVDISKVKTALKELYEEKAGLGSGDIDKAIAKDIQTRLDNLSSVKAVRLEDVQGQLEYFSNLSATAKGNVTPGTDVGVARKLHQVWKEVLNDAARLPGDEGTAARKLIVSRERFAERVGDLKNLQDTSLGVFFDQGKTGERVLAQPYTVIERLRKLPPDQREFFVSVMEQADSSVIESLRKNILNDTIEAASIKGASLRDPEWSPSQFLKEIEKRKNDIDFLFPNPAKKAEFSDRLEELRRMSQRTSVIHNGRAPNAEDLSTGVASLGAGRAGTAMVARGAMRTVADLFSDKDALADLLFGAKTNPETRAGRWANTAMQAGKQTPVVINREAELAREVFKPAEQGPIEGDPPQFILDMLSEDSKPKPQGVINDDLLDRLRKAESGSDPFAVSPKGAMGPYQFMPETAKEFGIDPFDPDQSREAARKYLQQHFDEFGSVEDALAAYNWGPGNLRKFGRDKIPDETRQYIQRILGQ